MIVIYKNANGYICKKVSVNQSAFVQEDIPGFEAVVVEEKVNIEKCYWDNGIKQKMQMSLTAPSSCATGQTIEISGIPNGTEVRWPDGVKTTESGSLTGEFANTGLYTFSFWHPHYFEQKVVINVA